MIPELGDIAWVEFGPIRGSEQDSRRPALVLTDRLYHEVSERAVVCPITRRARSWPFEVPLPPRLQTSGVVLVDQIRTIHRPSRMFGIVERAPDDLIRAVRETVAALLGIEIAS